LDIPEENDQDNDDKKRTLTAMLQK